MKKKIIKKSPEKMSIWQMNKNRLSWKKCWDEMKKESIKLEILILKMQW